MTTPRKIELLTRDIQKLIRKHKLPQKPELVNQLIWQTAQIVIWRHMVNQAERSSEGKMYPDHLAEAVFAEFGSVVNDCIEQAVKLAERKEAEALRH